MLELVTAYFEQFAGTPQIIYVVYVGVALGVFLAFTGVAQFLSRGENQDEARNRRVKMIAVGASSEEILAILKPDTSSGLTNRFPIIGRLHRLLIKSGLTMSPTTFVFFCSLLTLVALMALYFVIGIVLATPAAFVIGFALPIFALNKRVTAREQALVKQLPDALDLMARGLRVGHPLNTSIHEVAQEMPEPIGTEFGIMFDQVSLGDELTDAFQDFADRADVEDVRYLAASVGIQHGTGGDLSRVIQVLSETVRNRIAMRQRILAISAEGRLTGWFLSGLPFFIFGSTMMVNPSYYIGVMDEPLFGPVAGTVIFLTVANFLAVRRLVNFRI